MRALPQHLLDRCPGPAPECSPPCTVAPLGTYPATGQPATAYSSTSFFSGATTQNNTPLRHLCAVAAAPPAHGYPLNAPRSSPLSRLLQHTARTRTYTHAPAMPRCTPLSTRRCAAHLHPVRDPHPESDAEYGRRAGGRGFRSDPKHSSLSNPAFGLARYVRLPTA